MGSCFFVINFTMSDYSENPGGLDISYFFNMIQNGKLVL